jgi:hypothetical protein
VQAIWQSNTWLNKDLVATGKGSGSALPTASGTGLPGRSARLAGYRSTVLNQSRLKQKPGPGQYSDTISAGIVRDYKRKFNMNDRYSLEHIVLSSPSPSVKRLWRFIELSKKLDSAEGDLLHAALMELVMQPADCKQNLESLLGFNPGAPGERSAAFQLKMMMRNFALCQCLQLIKSEHRCGAWIGCSHLSREITKFKAGIFEKIRAGNRQIKNDIERSLYQAFTLDQKIPQDVGHLHKIINDLE